MESRTDDPMAPRHHVIRWTGKPSDVGSTRYFRVAPLGTHLQAYDSPSWTPRCLVNNRLTSLGRWFSSDIDDLGQRGVPMSIQGEDHICSNDISLSIRVRSM
jgi:hypothetical protein